MAWNGAGVFSRLYSWVTDAANGVDIDATRMDADTDDITTGLNNALCKDGQNTPTANLPMGGYKHTGVADGTARTHYASVGQAQDGSVTYCVAGGTADALALAFSPVVTALVDGQRFRFKASATNTGAATGAVNGITAKSIKQRDGSALAAGDIASGLVYDLQYVQSSDTLVLVNALAATQAEVDAGTDDSRFVTALKAATRYLAKIGGRLTGVLLPPTTVTLTDGATITPDFSAGHDFTVTLSGSRTIANPTNISANQSGSIVIKQDGTGSRTAAFGSYFKFPNGTAPTLTTTASATDRLDYWCESATVIHANLTKKVS